jgi:multiple sugar transport system permease protein
MIFAFVLWPAFEMIRTSFQEVSTSGITQGWAGLENYRTLLVNPDLPNVLIRTFIWVVGIVFFTILISLPVAQLLNAKYSLGSIRCNEFNYLEVDSGSVLRSAQ